MIENPVFVHLGLLGLTIAMGTAIYSSCGVRFSKSQNTWVTTLPAPKWVIIVGWLIGFALILIAVFGIYNDPWYWIRLAQGVS